jgi:hypothetical protein
VNKSRWYLVSERLTHDGRQDRTKIREGNDVRQSVVSVRPGVQGVVLLLPDLLLLHVPTPRDVELGVKVVLEPGEVDVVHVLPVERVVERLCQPDDGLFETPLRVAHPPLERRPLVAREPPLRGVVDDRADEGRVEVVDGLEVGLDVVLVELLRDLEGGDEGVVGFVADDLARAALLRRSSDVGVFGAFDVTVANLADGGVVLDRGGEVGDHAEDEVGEVDSDSFDHGFLQNRQREVRKRWLSRRVSRMQGRQGGRTRTGGTHKVTGLLVHLVLDTPHQLPLLHVPRLPILL